MTYKERLALRAEQMMPQPEPPPQIRQQAPPPVRSYVSLTERQIIEAVRAHFGLGIPEDVWVSYPNISYYSSERERHEVRFTWDEPLRETTKGNDNE